MQKFFRTAFAVASALFQPRDHALLFWPMLALLEAKIRAALYVFSGTLIRWLSMFIGWVRRSVRHRFGSTYSQASIPRHRAPAR
ncbi:MAG: hypothetical protein KGP14_17045 [Betaproteobacteria bacterium]|nr:hypothetical protein [Betaproteobacteria bacterium]